LEKRLASCIPDAVAMTRYDSNVLYSPGAVNMTKSKSDHICIKSIETFVMTRYGSDNICESPDTASMLKY